MYISLFFCIWCGISTLLFLVTDNIEPLTRVFFIVLGVFSTWAMWKRYQYFRAKAIEKKNLESQL
jgi:hypothetical protein